MDRQGMDRRRALAVFGGSVLAAALPPLARAEAPLILGIQATTWGAVGMVAEAEKLFEKAGVAVEVKKLDSGRSVRDAMVGERIDLGSLGAVPFVIGAAKGNMAALGAVAYAGGTLAVVGSRKEGIKSLADLKGKKVASQTGSETDYVFQTKIAPKYGLAPGKDFQVVNVKFQDHVAALAAGSVSAFAGVEPYPSLAEVEGIGNPLVDYSQFDLVPVLLAVNRSALDKRGDELLRFMKAWLAAARMFKEDNARVTRIVWDFYKARGYSVSQEVIRRSLVHMNVTPDFIPELKPYLTDIAQTLMKKGSIAAMPDWDKVLDRSLLARAGS